MPVATQQTPVGGAPPRKRFTVSEVERMLEVGLFAGQRLELIDGDLIDKMGQNPPHAFAIGLVLAWLSKICESERIRVQLPMQAGGPDRDRSLPEPDLAVLLDAKDDYRRRHPRGDELLLIVEVADTSVQYDASTKRDLYARAGVPEYWVLDVGGRQLIVHRRPVGGQFTLIQTFSEHDSVAPEFSPASTATVVSLLP
jgi:Uma2 family endonuclease